MKACTSTNLPKDCIIFHETGDDALELRRSDYSPGLAVNVIKRSFLLKYLLLNVQVLNYTSLVKNLFKKTPTEAFVGQTTAQVSAERLQDSKKAVDAFFGLLPEMSGLEPQNVLLAIDGMRPHLYSPKVLTTGRFKLLCTNADATLLKKPKTVATIDRHANFIY